MYSTVPHRQEIDLSLLTADLSLYPRSKLNKNRVVSMAETLSGGTIVAPVSVFWDGSTYWLSDGFIRFEAHKLVNFQTISADIRSGTRRDAILFAIECNAHHGETLARAERVTSAKKLLLDPEWGQWSNSHIGKLCGLNHETVHNIRQELQEAQNPTYSTQLLTNVSCDHRKIQSVTQDSNLQVAPIRKALRGGKEYTINTANIGKSRSKRVNTNSSHMEVQAKIIDLPELIDDTTILQPEVAEILYQDPQVIEVEAQLVDRFSLLDIDYQCSPQGDLSEYSLKILTSGPPNAMPLILERMRLFPSFAEFVLDQAQKLQISSVNL